MKNPMVSLQYVSENSVYNDALLSWINFIKTWETCGNT